MVELFNESSSCYSEIILMAFHFHIMKKTKKTLDQDNQLWNKISI